MGVHFKSHFAWPYPLPIALNHIEHSTHRKSYSTGVSINISDLPPLWSIAENLKCSPTTLFTKISM